MITLTFLRVAYLVLKQCGGESNQRVYRLLFIIP